MKVLIWTLLFSCLLSSTENVKIASSSENIWIKTYLNYKNYNVVLDSINKNEQAVKQEKAKKNIDYKKIQDLNDRLHIQHSKLSLYGQNNSFEEILKKYRYEIKEITLYDYLFEVSKDDLQKIKAKYELLRKEFYRAIVISEDAYQDIIKQEPNDKRVFQLQDRISYFDGYSENIEKMYQTFLDLDYELEKRYEEYKNEVFIKHMITLIIVVSLYILYKILLSIFFYSVRNKENQELEKSYQKILSLLFALSIFIFITVRYISDLIHILTLLGVVAAALTIATREIILNIAGAFYIFFSNVIREGDRIMVQFETKHTIGDIVSISLVKIKLHEVCDYTNIKEVKNVGRTIYIPNSYIFTKVFYNYSLKKNGTINDLLEFEFAISSDFDLIKQITAEIFEQAMLPHTMTFALNQTKTAINGTISYQVNYKISGEKKGELSIKLLKKYIDTEEIQIKTSARSIKKDDDSE